MLACGGSTRKEQKAEAAAIVNVTPKALGTSSLFSHPLAAITGGAEPRTAKGGSLGRSFPAQTQPMVLLCLFIMKCFTDAKTVQRADTLKTVFSAAFSSKLPHE